MSHIADCLLRWYDIAKRDLPWRENHDPYRIWVSEIMLQQTRVEAVKSYFARWMSKFPTVAALAAASEEDVLQAWQGLGYYSRARNLHQAAREVAARYGGQVPAALEAIKALPGVGEYTAGAIASIAYNRCVSAIDGNVLRIYSRLYHIGEDVMQGAVKRRIKQLVEQDMDCQRPGDFNQALMDLGSAICIPQTPRCKECPLAMLCQALAAGESSLLPVRRPKRPPKLVRLAAAVIQHENAVLLHQRSKRGLLAGMWEFPTVEADQCADSIAHLTEELRRQLQVRTIVAEELIQIRHVFTHRQWDLTFYHVEIHDEIPCVLPPGFCWMPKSEWSNVLWAGPHKKVAPLL